MVIVKKWQGFAAALALAAAIAVPAMAQDASQDLPEVVRYGDITYMTGGVGLEERDAMKTVAKDYNLFISNANGYGKFTAAVTIVIKDKDGKEIFTAYDTGPLLYAKIPDGSYTVEAVSGENRMVRKITVSGKKHANVHFVWSGSEMRGGADDGKDGGRAVHKKKSRMKKSSGEPVKETPKTEKAGKDMKDSSKEMKDEKEKKEVKKEESEKEKTGKYSKEAEKTKETKEEKKDELKKEDTKTGEARNAEKKEEKKINGWFKKKKSDKEETKKEEEQKEEKMKESPKNEKKSGESREETKDM